MKDFFSKCDQSHNNNKKKKIYFSDTVDFDDF